MCGACSVCLVDLVCFVYLVDLVHLVSFVQPNKRDKPKKPFNGLLMLADFFSILLASRRTDLLDGEPDDKTAAGRGVPFDPHPPA
jgi:hypothetical protein